MLGHNSTTDTDQTRSLSEVTWAAEAHWEGHNLTLQDSFDSDMSSAKGG